ncbi:hypothetical protein P4B35_23705 [Pontiellaceae bacterium B12227]|nr:hypothetical protein [Pontiellaceae bacterium B12227]
MDYHEELLQEARKAVAERPDLRSEIIDLFNLAVSEIEGGGSEAHEYELFMSSIEEIRKEKSCG